MTLVQGDLHWQCIMSNFAIEKCWPVSLCILSTNLHCKIPICNNYLHFAKAKVFFLFKWQLSSEYCLSLFVNSIVTWQVLIRYIKSVGEYFASRDDKKPTNQIKIKCTMRVKSRTDKLCCTKIGGQKNNSYAMAAPRYRLPSIQRFNGRNHWKW